MGVANDRSIAWGIAKKLNEHGAELAFTYVGDALKTYEFLEMDFLKIKHGAMLS